MLCLKLVAVLVLAIGYSKWVLAENYSDYSDIPEQCCSHGETFARNSKKQDCSAAAPPEDLSLEPADLDTCKSSLQSCCEDFYKQKRDCASGAKLTETKQCYKQKSDIGKTCCDECTFGKLTGESQGKQACGDPPEEDVSPTSALRKTAFRDCCLEAAQKVETTTEKKIEATTKKKAETTTKKIETTTKQNVEPTTKKKEEKAETTTRKEEKVETTTKKKQRSNLDVCKNNNPCEQTCVNDDGEARCLCKRGYRLAKDGTSCKDVNECAALTDDVCAEVGTVCHNTPGSYKCVPLRKREVSLNCPPGFKRNLENQVCDDINECQLPRPPCAKYLCENTVGGFKCGGKVGRPAPEDSSEHTTPSELDNLSPKDEMCPSGFRSGPNDECLDIDECVERVDDCQRLSQYCINTHGSFFCQNHVTKFCAPGFKVNARSGICEDINECDEDSEMCRSGEICVNLPGAYDCKSETSTRPQQSNQECPEGTRIRAGGHKCEDIDECREGSHLCDQSQNCINTYGGHECRCKHGFELDSSSSCVDIDECALKLDNCPTDQHCLNIMGTFTCTHRPSSPKFNYGRPSSSPTTPARTVTYPTARTTTTTTPAQPDLTENTIPTPPNNRPNYATRRPSYGRTPQRSNYIPTTSTVRPTRRYVPRVSSTTESATSKTIDLVTEEIESYTTMTVGSDRSLVIDTDKVSERRRTNITPRIDCFIGYEHDANGICVDINECTQGRHSCSKLEVCVNHEGTYTCNCVGGHRRDGTGWCVPIPQPTPVTKPARRTPATTPRSSTTQSSRTPMSIICELGYRFDIMLTRCVDVDECSLGRARCAGGEVCVNMEGGYECLPTSEETAPTTLTPSAEDKPGVITVGSQFGQRGPMYLRPKVTRQPQYRQIQYSCPPGYNITASRECADIDECATKSDACGAGQQCENFYGGYFCKCPAGHRMTEHARCKDIDECSVTRPCPGTAHCINTVGSFRCRCQPGFRNAPSSDTICEDVDECSEQAGRCEHDCVNYWGGYACTCRKGYKLRNDNRTCADVDECAEWAATGRPGKLCVGECINMEGSYKCSCPKGYTMNERGGCVDIDECETGEARCASRNNPSTVCQNTRGSYECFNIDCPAGYRLENKNRCSRIQRTCPLSDSSCLRKPGTYNYNFITIVSRMYLPDNSLDLFTMHGSSWQGSYVNFQLRLVEVKAGPDVKPANLNCFEMRPSYSRCVVSLLCSLEGPQTVEIELTMTLYAQGQFAGSAVSKLFVIVSQYEF